MAEHNELGKWGEELAAKYLEQKGYVIRDRDWRQGKLDLDIVAVADDGETVVFVEVKARKTNAFGQPEQAVDAKKIKRLARAADSYVKSLGVSAPLRFDIVSIIGDQKEAQTIEHIVDAFNPMIIV
jgi:putative endonuclease